jgi:hypothetical protein
MARSLGEKLREHAMLSHPKKLVIVAAHFSEEIAHVG